MLTVLARAGSVAHALVDGRRSGTGSAGHDPRRTVMTDAPADPRLFYQRHIFMCTNVRPEGHPRGCCSAGGSEKLRSYMREKARQMGIENIRCNASGCLERCELGPNMVIYPEGVWYHYETTQDIDEILETHVKNGGRVARLMLQPDQKALG
jgi:(2Fe-2S) ferredoxin